MQVGISLPVILKQQLDDAAIARRSTISGIMRQALVEWLERHANETELEPDTHLDDAR
jgi:predicted transcriptional regulator